MRKAMTGKQCCQVAVTTVHSGWGQLRWGKDGREGRRTWGLADCGVEGEARREGRVYCYRKSAILRGVIFYDSKIENRLIVKVVLFQLAMFFLFVVVCKHQDAYLNLRHLRFDEI